MGSYRNDFIERNATPKIFITAVMGGGECGKATKQRCAGILGRRGQSGQGPCGVYTDAGTGVQGVLKWDAMERT